MDRPRLISLLIAAVYVVVMINMAVAETDCGKPSGEHVFDTIVGTFFWLVSSLACIWWGDELGEGLTGAWFGMQPITASSPGAAVRLMGWIILLLPGIIMLLGYAGILQRLI